MSELIGLAEKIVPYLPAGVTPASLCVVKMVPSWNLALPEDLDEPIEVIMSGGGSGWALKMTQHTLFTLAGNFGITKSLLVETPPNLTQPLMNYWLDVVGAENSPRFVYNSSKVALDLYRPYNVPPVNALDLMQSAADHMAEAVGGEVVDAAAYMTLGFHELTLRLFFPPLEENVVTSTWQAGVQITTSPSGQLATSMVMVFRRIKDGLMFTLPHHEFKYSQKRHGASPEAFGAWLHDGIGLIAADVAEERKHMKDLVGVDVEEDLQIILDDLYAEVSLPMRLRALVNEEIEDMLPSGATAWDLLVCIAKTAMSDEPEPQRERLRRAAGRLHAVLGDRCDSCHSLLKDHS